MAAGSIIEQLLRDPENMIDGIVNQIRDDVAKQITEKWVNDNQEAIEQMVNERLTEFRGFLRRQPHMGESIDVSFFLDREKQDIGRVAE